MKYILAIFLCLGSVISSGQSDTTEKSTGTDTLLNKMLRALPVEMHKEFIEDYNKMDANQRKQMLAVMDVFSSMPTSSKKQLIENIDTNYANIAALKSFFKSIVPAGYSIYIEFKPPEKVLNLDESIDFWVYKKKGKNNEYETVFQDWNIELKSTKLDSLLTLIPVKRNDLQNLRKHAEKAHCISVRNGDAFEVGYARSGMGKYSYLIFDKPLSKEEQKKYNNGCEYIFYKNNIVLQYGGGAIGPQCFPDM